MYRTLHVPADNSDHSNAAIDLAVGLARVLGARVVGSHAYAAKLHDVRFKQMEFTLPDEYKEEEELEKQRRIHDALIARGLHLISESYLDQLDARCKDAGVPCERRYFDGRNFEVIVDDILASDNDLVILGALGMGAVRGSQVGSVCERVLRRVATDTLVVRRLESARVDAPGPIVVGLDGSPTGHGAVAVALHLAAATDREVRVVGVVEDGDDKALLAAHLTAAARLAERAGVAATTEVAEGRAHAVLAERAREAEAWLLVVGRGGDGGGVAPAEAVAEPGPTAEHLVRQAEVNVLVVGRAVDVAARLVGAAA